MVFLCKIIYDFLFFFSVDLSSASENECDSDSSDTKDLSGYACHHCYTTSIFQDHNSGFLSVQPKSVSASKNWHHAGKNKTLLCVDCRLYFKKYGELRPVDRSRTPPPFLFTPVREPTASSSSAPNLDNSDHLVQNGTSSGGVKTRRAKTGNSSLVTSNGRRKPLTPTADMEKMRTTTPKNLVASSPSSGKVGFLLLKPVFGVWNDRLLIPEITKGHQSTKTQVGWNPICGSGTATSATIGTQCRWFLWTAGFTHETGYSRTDGGIVGLVWNQPQWSPWPPVFSRNTSRLDTGRGCNQNQQEHSWDYKTSFLSGWSFLIGFLSEFSIQIHHTKDIQRCRRQKESRQNDSNSPDGRHSCLNLEWWRCVVVWWPRWWHGDARWRRW